jgi:ribosomal-protein-alanine N-acetyltransferase
MTDIQRSQLGPATHLRLVAPDDAATLARLFTDSWDHLRPFQPSREPAFFTEPGQRQRIESALAAADSGASVPFLIESGAGEIVGELTLSGITYGAFRSCAMGYWIRSDRLRHGHASAAVELALTHAFDTLHLHRVQAETLPENLASQAILDHAGFTSIGVAPDFLRINGAWRDHILFQRLNAEAD